MEKGIRTGAFLCALILIVTLIIAVIPTEAEAKIYTDTVRLHIIAESDEAEDQALKLRVRDLVLGEYGEYLGTAESSENAVLLIEDRLYEIEERVNRFIQDEGYSYTAHATIGKEWFDTRVYEEYTLPQGYYYSLIIKIGRGEGKNWWCVMYPPMCLGVASSSGSSFSKEEEKMISEGKRNIKFKLLEVVSQVLK